jgi:hypothetical protein
MAGSGFCEGGFVNGAIDHDEAVICPVEVAACVVSVILGPVFVLRLEDSAGTVPKSNEGGKAFSDKRAV